MEHLSLKLENIKIQKDSHRKKMADIKALAHFIPRKIPRYHTQRNGSLDLASILDSPFSQSNKKPMKNQNRSSIFKRKNMKRNAVKTEVTPEQNKSHIFRSSNFLIRLNKSAVIPSSVNELIKERKRMRELINIISQQKKRANQKNIEKNTQQIQVEMQKQQFLRYFERMENFLVKKQRESNQNIPVQQRIESLSKDYVRFHKQSDQPGHEINFFEIIKRNRKYAENNSVSDKQSFQDMQKIARLSNAFTKNVVKL